MSSYNELTDFATRLYIKLNCYSFAGVVKSILLVEGQTDKMFIEKMLDQDTRCMVANQAFGESRWFSGAKDSIVKMINSLERKCGKFLDFPALIDSYNFFGLVDLDFDDPNQDQFALKTLFVTDTHDLETMMLFTDKEVLNRIADVTFEENTIKQSFVLAYQIGLIKKANKEKDIGLDWKPLSGEKGLALFVRFIDSGSVNIKNLITCLCETGEKPVLSKSVNEIYDKLLSHKRIKKSLDDNGEWKCTDYLEQDDFWQIINGHDVLVLLRFLNSDVEERYGGQLVGLNRDFEKALIDSYDYIALKKTKMFKKMQQAGMIESAS